MPELPEVETVRAYLARVRGHRLDGIEFRRPDLRYPMPVDRAQSLSGGHIAAVRRRGKYLLLDITHRDCPATLLVHLGMSGRLFLDPRSTAPYEKHEHVRVALSGEGGRQLLRFVDPRRFGALDVIEPGEQDNHWLLAKLGPEPLQPHFDGAWLHRASRGRQVAVKQLIMDAKTVVGVGNIYASEALWRARIRPARRAATLTRPACNRLAAAIKAVLTEAVAMGGTTLRDFVGGDAAPGYFQQRLDVYNRAGQPCGRCEDRSIQRAVLQQRMTYWCAGCQR